MFRTINTIVALTLLTLPFYAQGGPLVDINISGKVTDTNNNAISGATVTLETAKLSDTTGDNGTFSIDYISQVGISRNAPQHSNGLEATIHKNNLSVRVPKQSLVTLTTYSLQGRVISRMQKNLNAGTHHIAVHSAESNIYLYKVTSGTTEILLKGISMGTFQQGTPLVDQSIASTSTLKKMVAVSDAFSDILKVTKNGYEDFSMNIDNPKMSAISIQLKPTKNTTIVKPDIVVAKDGSGDFAKVEDAINSISKSNKERKIIYIKNGTYNEHILLSDRSFITLLGEDRYQTKIYLDLEDERKNTTYHNDGKGVGVFNIANSNDLVIDNLTIENTGDMGLKTYTVYSSGSSTRIVVQNADILGLGGDTFSLWSRGLYYHRNIRVTGTYHFMGPRGTTYMVNSIIESVGQTIKACFNEGNKDNREKLVLHRVKFQSKYSYGLGSYFRDAAWYFISCEFDNNLKTGVFKEGGESVSWGVRIYFADSKGPDFPWLKDNISSSPAKTASAITAAWTFSGQWDPESTAPPEVVGVSSEGNAVVLKFNESVTVKGSPSVLLADGSSASYSSGSGSTTISFSAGSNAAPQLLKLNGGAIIASIASSGVRGVPDSFKISK